MRIISNLGIKFNIIEDNFNIYENGIKYLPLEKAYATWFIKPNQDPYVLGGRKIKNTL